MNKQTESKSLYLKSWIDPNFWNLLLIIITLPFLVIGIFTFFYHVLFWVEIKSIYPELARFDPREFFSLSSKQSFLFAALLAFAMLIIGFFRLAKGKVWAMLFVGVLPAMVLWLVQLIHINYFSIMQVPFQASILGNGLETYWKEIAHSVAHEVQGRFIRLGLAGIVSLFFLTLLIGLGVKKLIQIFPAQKASKYFVVISIVYIVIGIVYFRIPSATIPASLMTPGGISLDLVSLRQNPLYTLYAFKEKNKIDEASVLPHNGEKNERSTLFRFGFDTSSLVHSDVIPGLKVKRKKYNIVYYFFESTAQSYLGYKYQGKSVTPVWDRLAKNSLVSKNHYAHFPLSVNAMYNVLASSYHLPSNQYITFVKPNIVQSSISAVLKKNGYRTGIIHTGNLKNFAHDAYLKHRNFDLILDMKNLKNDRYPPLNEWAADDRSMYNPIQKFISQEKDKPFFLALFPILPHHPYLVPEKKFKITQEEYNRPGVTAKRKRWLRYINSLYYSDIVLGQIVKIIEESRQDTIFFIFADHAEAFYQHPQNYLHALFLYEENVHVPFLIYQPRLFPKEKEYPGISRHIDIAATSLDFIGLKKPLDMEGISLISAHRKQFAYLHTQWTDDLMGVRDGPWKYILRRKDGYEELYNILDDPEEKKNRTKEYPALAQRFRSKVLQLRSYQRDYFLNKDVRLK